MSRPIEELKFVEEWSADEQHIVDRLKRASAPYVTLGIVGYDNLLRLHI